MRCFLYNIFISLFLLACSNSEGLVDSGENIAVKSFSVKVNGENIEGNIDNENGIIALSGIKNGLAISDVEYELSDGATIYPLPETKIGNWGKEENFRIYKNDVSKNYKVVLSDFEEIQIVADAKLYPQNKFGRVTKYFFYDLKGWPNSLSQQKANEVFSDGINGLRIPIFGDIDHPAHPSSGVVVEDEYQGLLNSINNAKQANIGKPMTIFASKKLKGDESFPDWVINKKAGKISIKVDEYVQLLVDYISFMKRNNVIIDVLGIDNEPEYNKANITPEQYKDIVDKLKLRLKDGGFKIPLFIGPERYSPQGNVSGAWLQELYEKKYEDRLDIYGTHYYPKHHTQSWFNKLKYEHSLIGTKEFWATEPHWDNDDAAKVDMLKASEQAICALWDQTDLGMDAFMWWSYEWSGTLRGNLMRSISVPLLGSQPVKIVDHDGEDIMTLGKLQTRAFIADNIINLYILNVVAKAKVSDAVEYEGYKVQVDESVIDGDVTYTFWTDETSVSGEKLIAEKLNDNIFSLNIPKRSIIHVKLKIK